MYGRFRSDNMSGTTLGKDLVSLKFKASGNDAAIENGNVVVVGKYIAGEVREATVPAASSDKNVIAVIGSEEIIKSKKNNTLGEFINEAGVISRGYRLRSGDLFSVTAEALAGTPAVGSLVELQADTKLKVVTTATAGSTTIGKIVLNEGIWYVIEVA